MASGKYPKVIYVQRQKDGDTSYLVAHEKAAGAAVIGSVEEVAVYTFSGIAKVITKVIVD